MTIEHVVRALSRVFFAGAVMAQTGFGGTVNLIVNPGNEAPLVAGVIPGWTEVEGSNWTQRSTDPVPFEGDYYFFAGVGAAAELAQLVNVSDMTADIDAGIARFAFTGRVRSYDQWPRDSARIVVEYRAAGGDVLGSFDSGEITNASDWELVSDSRLAPVGTRGIEVRLLSTRYAGSNNDGYFDALSLTASTDESAAPEPATFWVMATGVTIVAGRRGGRVRALCRRA